MGLPKPLLLLLLLTTIVSTSQKPIVTEARPLSQQSKNYTISLFCFFFCFSLIFGDFRLYYLVSFELQDFQRFSRHLELLASVVMAKKVNVRVHGQGLALSSSAFPGN